MALRRTITLAGLLLASSAVAYVSATLPKDNNDAKRSSEAVRPRAAAREVEGRTPAAAAVEDPSKPRFLIYSPDASSRRVRDDQFIYFLDGIPDRVRAASLSTKQESNIERADYHRDVSVCKDCHSENYQKWSSHPHRFMNADVAPEVVKGDFDGGLSIAYMGGVGRFLRKDGVPHIRAERGTFAREFRLTRTIGSRFFQYYVGLQIEGPEPKTDPRYTTEQVMPFGWWIDRKRWVPTEHLPAIGSEYPDDVRSDVYEKFPLIPYYRLCHYCHTTLAQGDWLLMAPSMVGRATNTVFGLDVKTMLGRLYPAVLEQRTSKEPRISANEYTQIWSKVDEAEWPKNTISLGVTCEACHLGTEAHLADSDNVMPKFFPVSPAIATVDHQLEKPYGRTVANVNYICGRCHNSARQSYPDGTSVWNSAEHRDMLVGNCTSQLKCTHCHDPHEAIGAKWKLSEDENDALCVKCHAALGAQEARAQHTHHGPSSAGSHCMNCHMPYVNEGLQDVVRTHAIQKPTDPRTIQQNGPNACNVCHIDRSIDWTLSALEKWYGRKYDSAEIDRNYHDRSQPMGSEWLQQGDNIRLVAAQALVRADARWALPQLVEALDDPVMTNRQFAQIAVERMTHESLWDQGYVYWHMPDERREILAKLKARYAK